MHTNDIFYFIEDFWKCKRRYNRFLLSGFMGSEVVHELGVTVKTKVSYRIRDERLLGL